jgi:hypothetical protein
MVLAIAASGAERVVRYYGFAAGGHAQYSGAKGHAYAAAFTRPVLIDTVLYWAAEAVPLAMDFTSISLFGKLFFCQQIYHIEIQSYISYSFTVSHNEIYLKIIQLFYLIHILLYLQPM